MSKNTYQKVSVEWETDGENIDLPKVVEIPENIKSDEDITDYLSNNYGWLVESFTRISDIEDKKDVDINLIEEANDEADRIVEKYSRYLPDVKKVMLRREIFTALLAAGENK